jgi:hypothetical protein
MILKPRKIVFPCLLFLALFFLGGSVLFGSPPDIPTTFLLSDNGTRAESQFDLTFTTDLDATDYQVIQIFFNGFGTSGTDFDLSNVSTNPADYIFQNFDINPTTITIDNVAKVITFSNANIIAGTPNTRIASNNPAFFIRNDEDVETQSININIRQGFSLIDTGSAPLALVANQSNSVTAQITAPVVRQVVAGSSGNTVTYRITPSDGNADTFKIQNPFTSKSLIVSSITIDGTSQFIQKSAVRPTLLDHSVWDYNTGTDILTILTRQIAVNEGRDIDIEFEFDAPTAASTGNNFDLTAFDDAQDPALEDTINITNNNVDFDIIADALDHFTVVVASPQTTGIDFVGPSTVTAEDQFDNAVVGFDANVNNVTVTASNGGAMVDNVITAVTAFVNGVCDLTDIDGAGVGTDGVQYNGPSSAGGITFTATSAGPAVSGTSGNVVVDASGVIGAITFSAPLVATNVSADGASFTYVVDVDDGFGNPVADGTVINDGNQLAGDGGHGFGSGCAVSWRWIDGHEFNDERGSEHSVHDIDGGGGSVYGAGGR